MDSKFDDDKSSITNVSLLDENISSPRNLSISPTPVSSARSSDRRFSTMNADELAVATTSLKGHEKSIDSLTKENFNLKLHQYFLMDKLNNMSPENCQKLNEENIKLKVSVKSLAEELKKYKNMILELNQAIDFLQSKTCSIPHGMSEAEKEDFDKIKNEASASQEEIERLSLSKAELTAENIRLRTEIRTAKANKIPTNTTESDETIELKKSLRQAKIKIDEQQRAMQMSHKNQSNRFVRNQSEDRELNAHLKQLEGELRMEKLKSDRNLGELQDIKIELSSSRTDLDRHKQLLHNKSMELNNLREKYEQSNEINQKNNSNDDEISELIKAVQELEEDNEELVSAIQKRDQDIADLETEMEKLLSHIERKDEESEEEDNISKEEKLIMLEELIQEREQEINILKNELKSAAEAHDEDIEAFEEHMNKAEIEINKQKQFNQELIEELENTKKYCQDDLTKQYNEMIVSIRERDVRIASLEGNFEQKTDTMQRERDLLVEEIGELKDRLHQVYNELNRHEETIMDLRSMMKNNNRDDNSSFTSSNSSLELRNAFQKRSEELENKYRNTCDQLRQELVYTHEENKKLQHGYRELKQRFISLKAKKDQMKSAELNSASSSSDTSSILSRLNSELRRELEEKERELNQVKRRGDDFEDAYLQVQNNNVQLQKQLDRRDSMLTNSLIAHDKLKDEGDFMTNILYEQATGGGHPSLRRTPDYAMGSY